MTNFEEIQILVHQHAAHLMLSGTTPEDALRLACRLAVLSHDEGYLRKLLQKTARELQVQPVLAELPRYEATCGGATVTLPDGNKAYTKNLLSYI